MGESDDFTQQTFGKLEFGQDSQQSYQPWKPQGTNQQLGDFAQKTGESDDLTQQTSGNLEFGQGSKQSFPIWQSNVRNQKWGHLTQETGAQPEDDLQKKACRKNLNQDRDIQGVGQQLIHRYQIKICIILILRII